MKSFLKAACVALCMASVSTAGAQAIFSEKLYSTGEKLEKPMVMTPLVEFTHARKMPELSLKTLDGAPVNLSDYKGKLLILNVWASWCAPCIREMPQLIELQKQLKDSKIEIVGVSIDTKASEVKKLLKKHKTTEYRTWIDPTESVQSVMPLEVVPTNFIIDSKGNLVGYLPGFLPWNDKDIPPFLKKLEEKYVTP